MFSPDQCRIRPSRALWARRQISDSFFLCVVELRVKKRREEYKSSWNGWHCGFEDAMRWFFFSFQLEHSRISGWHVAITSVEGATSCHSSFPFETVASSRSRHLLNLIIRRNVYRLTGVTVVVYSNAWIVFIIWCRSSRQTGNGQNQHQRKENLSCAKITSTNYGDREKKDNFTFTIA